MLFCLANHTSNRSNAGRVGDCGYDSCSVPSVFLKLCAPPYHSSKSRLLVVAGLATTIGAWVVVDFSRFQELKLVRFLYQRFSLEMVDQSDAEQPVALWLIVSAITDITVTCILTWYLVINRRVCFIFILGSDWPVSILIARAFRRLMILSHAWFGVSNPFSPVQFGFLGIVLTGFYH
jgi:hypothetical protein